MGQSADKFNQRGLAAFREAYPKGRNFVVTPRRAPPVTRRHGDLDVTHAGLDQLRDVLSG